MGRGLLTLSPGEVVRQGGSTHSCRLSSGGRISKTLSTTGEEVFFKLATASPRVTPVKSTPLTFNKMSPARGGSTAFKRLCGTGVHHLPTSHSQTVTPQQGRVGSQTVCVLLKACNNRRHAPSCILLAGNSKNTFALHCYANANVALLQYRRCFITTEAVKLLPLRLAVTGLQLHVLLRVSTG